MNYRKTGAKVITFTEMSKKRPQFLQLFHSWKQVIGSLNYYCPLNFEVPPQKNISLFSDSIFKGVGRHPKLGKKKGGINLMFSIFSPIVNISMRETIAM